MKKITFLVFLSGLFFYSYSIDINFVKQLEGTSRAAAFYGDYAYVSTGHKINILNISDPENIQPVYSIMVNGNNYVNTLVVDENKEILVVGMDFNVEIYSITNPASPLLLSSIQYGCDKAIIDENILIFGTDHIYFYDISDVSDPVYLSSILADFASGNFCIKDEILYSFTQGGYSGPHVIASYNISDPANPQWITHLEIGPYYAPWPDEIDVKDDYIFLALADSLKIFEIMGNGELIYSSWFVFPSEIHSFRIDGNNLYAGLETGLAVYDISDMENIQQEGSYEYETYIRDIDVSGNLTFIAGNTNGYKVLNTEDFSNIEEKYYFPYTDITYGVCLNGNLAFISLYNRGLQAVLLQDPVNPENIANIEARPMRVLKYNSDAVYGLNQVGDDTLFIFDVTDVLQMSLAAIITSQTGISDFVFSGDYLLINEYDKGIRIFDISDPFNPEEAGTLPLTTGTKLAVDNNILFVGGQYGMTDTARIKIAAFDISNLPQITFLSDYFFDDTQKYHIEKIIPDMPYLYLGVWKGLVAMEYDNGFSVNDEQLYLDPDYNICKNFLKDNEYIYFNISSNVFDTKAIKIINGTQLQEKPLSVNFVPNIKYDQYFYSMGFKNGFSIFKQGELIFDPPQNLMVSITGDCTVELTWDPPQSGTPSYYLIYQNGEQIDSVTGNSYIFDIYFSSYNEFYVVAGYIDPDGLSTPSNTVYLGIPGGYTVPYWEDFEYGCINWFTTPIVGNDNFYHCDTVSYEGDYSLAWYSETQGNETKCGPQYITPVVCPDIFVSFYYKTPEKAGNYDKLYLYLDDSLFAGPLQAANEWTKFYAILDCSGEDFNLDFKAVGDNGGGIFIDKYKVDMEIGIDESKTTENIKLFPNPVTEKVYINLNSETGETCNIEVLTASGEAVASFNKNLDGAGHQTVSIDVSNLKSGIYYLKIISNEGVAVRKFVVSGR